MRCRLHFRRNCSESDQQRLDQFLKPKPTCQVHYFYEIHKMKAHFVAQFKHCFPLRSLFLNQLFGQKKSCFILFSFSFLFLFLFSGKQRGNFSFAATFGAKINDRLFCLFRFCLKLAADKQVPANNETTAFLLFSFEAVYVLAVKRNEKNSQSSKDKTRQDKTR